MADIELHRSLSVLQEIHEEQYIGGEGSLYSVYDHHDQNNNQPLFYTDHYCDDPMQSINFMLSGSNYQQPIFRGDIDDSPDSDDSSVVLDERDIELIQFFETENSDAQEQFHPSAYTQLQQLHRSIQPPSNNLPAFETLFNGKRNSNNVNRLHTNQMTDSEDDEESNSICRKGKRGAKNVLLWKFLLEELKVGKHVEWTDISQGTFRFVDTCEISRLWGQKKRKDDMNFEKLSRGIRHYYKSGFMSRQEGTRLIYRFNWAKVPKKYRQYDIKRGTKIKHMSY